MPEGRPDPDALLRELRKSEEREKRGLLKIFLGMAAGVGKTFAMLTEAQEQLARGVDVVAGYIEPHERPETAALAEKIESIPRREVEHRGVILYEFDIDATLKRKPRIVLVDEAAHTNAPGSRHPKRWQDIEELLHAGINVYTTLNIQHVESLNDVVAKSTGILVRETVPDSFIEKADEIELIDLPPDELLQRLQEGKVYAPHVAQQALQGFFKKSNLFALRDLALRVTYQHNETSLDTYRTEAGSPDGFLAAQRMLVCVAPNELAIRVVRSARRLAGTMHAEVFAVTVDNPRHHSTSPEGMRRMQEAMDLAASLGMEPVTLEGTDVVDEVMRFARSRGVSLIVVGKPLKPRWRELLFGSVVDDLVRHSGEIDIYVITDAAEGSSSSPPLRLNRPRPSALALAVGVPVAVSAIGVLLLNSPFYDPGILMSLYLLGVALVATRTGPTEAAVTSVLGVLGFSFFLAPELRFGAAHVRFVLTFCVMMLVALLISTLALRLRRQAELAQGRERRTSALHTLSKELAATRSKRDACQATAEKVRRLFDADVAVMLVDGEGGLAPMVDSAGGFEKAMSEQAVARWAFDHAERAGRGTNTLPGSEALYSPLSASGDLVGILAARRGEGARFDEQELKLLDGLCSQLALTIERIMLAKERQQVHVSAEREKARASLLGRLSQDLGHPLDTIEETSSALLRADGPVTAHREQVEQLHAAATRLSQMVRNLQQMHQLEQDALPLRREAVDLETVLRAALQRTRPLLGDRPLQLLLETGAPEVSIDSELIQQVFINLLENAARHTPAGTPVEVHLAPSGKFARVEVSDRGPGLPSGEQERIFEQFHKGTEGGFGLGLSLCRGIVEAHGGRIFAKNRFGGGATFVVELPTLAAAPVG